MVNQCQNCGSALRYDIALAKLKCDHCDSTFSAEEYHRDTNADEYRQEAEYDGSDKPQEYEATVYTCPNCGAELTANEEDAVDYCMYCGSFTTLYSHLMKIRMPDGIIPFEKTKEDCEKIYSKMMLTKLYAPKEFRDKNFLKGFRGAYIPYWVYDYTYGPKVHFQGSECSREGDYKVTQWYKISCDLAGEVNGISYDASSTFDDTISEHLAPFDSSKIKEYNPSYMFGFFSDTADVEEDVFSEDAMTTAADAIWDKVIEERKVREGHPDKPETNAKFSKAFNTKETRKLALLPVWFLTWRKGDRVAYSAVNGESGRIYSEIPIDPLRYIIISLITAVPIFFLLNMSITLLGNEMVNAALVLSTITTFLYMLQLEKIVRRLFHADDKGFLSVNTDAKEKVEEKVSENLLLLLVDFVKEIFSFKKGDGILTYIIGIGVLCYFGFTAVSYGLILVVLIVPVYVIIRIIKCANILHDKTVYVDVAGSLLAMVVCVLVLFIDPAHDMYYYETAIVSIIAIAATAILTIRRYNQLITRPVPRWEEVSK